MIQGTVNATYEAVVSLPLRGPAGQARDMDAVVDTGFTRFLTLPTAMVVELGLRYRGVNSVILVDGSEKHSKSTASRCCGTASQERSLPTCPIRRPLLECRCCIGTTRTSTSSTAGGS